MRITDQYFWNFIFSLFFVGLVIMGTIILESEAYKAWSDLAFVDFALIALATFRTIRLMVYDKITEFFREQFWDVHTTKSGAALVKPPHGPRRTLADLLSCPWCFGVWAAASVSFFYLLTPYAFYPILFMALSSVATFLQLFSNLIGWKAEQLKMDVESRL